MKMRLFFLLPALAMLTLVVAQEKEPVADPAAPRAKKQGAGKATAKAKTKAKAKAGPQVAAPAFLVPLGQRYSSKDAALHRDFPDLCIEGSNIWTVYIEHDGQGDVLCLAKRQGRELAQVARLSQPGVIHQPAIAADGDGGVWCVWAQANEQDVMTLRGRRFAGGKMEAEVELAAEEDAGSSFADAATDAAGRVWVTWQEVKPGASQIWTRYWSPNNKEWSAAVSVSALAEGGNWEPRLAFSDAESAWIVYDSSAGSEFNLRLAKVKPDGHVKDTLLVQTPDYEARASITADGAGGLWIAAERGRQQWGLDARGHEGVTGFNAQKRLLLGRYDIASGEFTEVPVPHNGRPTPVPDPSPGFAVNVPSVAFRDGQVWLSYRYFSNAFWRVAVTRYDPVAKRWAEPAALPESTMGQDRHQELTVGPKGALWVTWPTDNRTTKLSNIAQIHTGMIKTDAPWPLLPEEPEATVTRAPEQEPYLNEPTPPRPLSELHTWTIGGKTYRLVWGDVHRHTDISNCRTGFDGCIVEAYRYAYDLAGLDFMGTSDHTDVGKIYHPYEWWHTQRQVDVFYAPGQFASLYAYEREQPFPWGHRNILFTKRGGPLVYINRAYYRASPWQEELPVAAGIQPIQPKELWDILKRYDQPCAIVSHTGATGMGTDWTQYEGGIDNTYENTVEIFQGARVSYEGLGLPQPTVGLRKSEPYTPHKAAGDEHPKPPGVITDFDAGFPRKPGYNNGVYQKALEVGHKLGVFASSDHIATHTSFGGVYVEDFTREGIIAGFNARRTCAATDKIFVQFSSGDHLMGEVFETAGKPELNFLVGGTAPVKRITIVRNEQDLHVMEPGTKEVSATWTDPAPVDGENRYYLRIEQSDGNMAWSSPLWVTVR
ncbi:hypothetical protein WJU23_03725 [Prosthecobacter sp. SYSU 5D2]|uniref:hypothetical protein n=1 Tax=Prosthecobacter sp. SYSU 5D2 TaxID=3134134 RepID=UPI0031FF134F